MKRLLPLLVLAAALASGGAGVATSAKPPAATASAYGISVVVPGQAGASAGAAAAPGGSETGIASSFAFPADGSIVAYRSQQDEIGVTELYATRIPGRKGR